MTDAIRGKVARILNARELVVNKGADDGIEIGMQLAILNEGGVDITDPDTGDVLGSIEVPKVLVKVVHVSARLAVASTFRKFRTAGGPFYHAGNLSKMLGMADAPREYVESLKTDQSTYKEELRPEDSYVHVGDPFVQVLGDEFAGWV